MTFHQQNLKNTLDARGISPELLASLTSISAKTIVRCLEEGKVPTKNQLFKMSHVLAVPAYAFFMDNFVPDQPQMVDYRSRRPSTLKFGRNTQQFMRVYDLRNFLAELFSRLDFDAPQMLIGAEPDENPEQFAAAVGKLIKIDALRESSKNKRDFYRNFRAAVEDIGIFVVQDHYFSKDIDGFALYHEQFSSNLIYINSSSRNEGAKSFTLAHELAHILGKRSAISNNYEADNDIEKFCNSFAASLLLPRDSVFATIERHHLNFENYETALESAQIISRDFKTSVSAALVRTAELGVSKWAYFRTFNKAFGEPGFLDSLKPRGGGANPDGPEPGVIDMAQFGRRAVSVIAKAAEKKVTNEYEIFKRTGLSRKRIDGLIQIAKKENMV